MSVRIIAIDWSGDVRNAARKIWLAEAVDNELRRNESAIGPAIEPEIIRFVFT